jgi:hypothetical protein
MSMKIEITVKDDNAFNAGWLAYLLGLPKPEDEDGARGWASGEAARDLRPVRRVFERPGVLYNVTVVDTEAKPAKVGARE